MANIKYNANGDLVYVDPVTGQELIYNLGDTSFVLNSMCLVFLMSPGVGFFYSGLLRRKNSLSAVYVTMAALAVVIFQWFIWGFSLTFSETGSPFIGNMKYFGLMNILTQPPRETKHIPMLLYCVYEMMFAAITAAIAIGAIAERGRPGPILIFIFIWTTIVYDPIARWTWDVVGWSNHLGVLDFAGGIAVHITSGAAALAISIHLGERCDFKTDAPYKANNVTNVVLGTVMMWFGWFGFNGGSALSANLTAVQACINTNIAAAAGGLTGVVLDYRIQKKWGAVSFCSGAIAGLITITPGSGFVGAPAALLFGVLGGAICNMATLLKGFGYDDALDIFATHGIGGLLGSILTGIFAQASIASLSGDRPIRGGWLDSNWKQVGIQAAGSLAAMAYSYVVTTLILEAMALAPVLSLRASRETQILGIDNNEMGEQAFDNGDFPHSQNVNQAIAQAMSRS
ncbi:ammonium transporter [Crassisporium funariophilum]|nr:ammonium transporter [Crassisporium funariophilum]